MVLPGARGDELWLSLSVGLRCITAWRWSQVFGPDFSKVFFFKPPVEKHRANLQWRLVHGAIATKRHVARLNPAVGRGGAFCGVDETGGFLTHHCFIKHTLSLSPSLSLSAPH